MKSLRHLIPLLLLFAVSSHLLANSDSLLWMMHGTPAWNVPVFSHDGGLVAYRTATGAQFADAVTGAIRGTIHGSVLSIAFSPGGTIACGSTQGKVFLIEPSAYHITDTLRFPSSNVIDVEFTSDGQFLAALLEEGSVVKWSIDEKKMVRQFAIPGVVIEEMRVSRTGRDLALREGDNLWVFDIGTGERLGLRRVPGALAMEFTPDGEKLLVAVHDQDGYGLYACDNLLGNPAPRISLPLRGFFDGTRALPRIAVTPDGEYAAVATGRDSALVMVRISDGEHGTGLYFEAPVHAATFSPDGRWLGVAGNGLNIHQIDARTYGYIRDLPLGHYELGGSAIYTPDGGRVITYGWYDRILRIWDPRTGTLLRTLRNRDVLWPSLADLHEGRGLATVYGCGEGEYGIGFWDIESGGVEGSVPCQEFGAIGDAPMISPDGRHLVTTLAYHWRLFDAIDGKNNGTFGDNTVGEIHARAFSPDSRTLATAGSDRIIRAWDLASGEQLGAYGPLPSYITALAYAPDNTYLVSASMDGEMRAWALVTRESPILTAHIGPVNCIAFSEDGKWFVSAGADRTVRVWNVAAWSVAYTYTYPGDSSIPGFAWQGLALAPDFSSITAISSFGDVVTWSTGPVFRTMGVVKSPAVSVASLSVTPNPSAGPAAISFDLPSAGDASVRVFDLLGREVATITAGAMEAGEHSYRWDTGGIAPGLYIIRLDGSGAHAAVPLVVSR